MKPQFCRLAIIQNEDYVKRAGAKRGALTNSVTIIHNQYFI